MSSAPEEQGGATGTDVGAGSGSAETAVATPAAGAAPSGVEPAPADPVHQRWLEALQRALGEAVRGYEIARGDLWARVDRSVWRQAAQLCRDELGCSYFCFVSGIDWRTDVDISGEKVWDPAPPASSGSGNGAPAEGGPPSTGLAGGDTRFCVLARLYSPTAKAGVTLKADLDDDDPRVESLVPLYRGADWHERETWEMFGFDFEGHPGLRHLYLPSEFEGHPLRKDFPLLAREVKPWPGLVDVEPMPGEPEDPAGEEAAEGDEAASGEEA